MIVVVVAGGGGAVMSTGVIQSCILPLSNRCVHRSSRQLTAPEQTVVVIVYCIGGQRRWSRSNRGGNNSKRLRKMTQQRK
mmetsp:Transcript_11950/g.28736  ORF Transcript_11950/g.28736 Transcript_11950/m.28736 type:complete len:80 (+) Transcript_11950:3572-3811(+)